MINNEKMKTYKPVFIHRDSGLEQEANYTVSLYHSEVINKQVENSTAKTVCMYKEVIEKAKSWMDLTEEVATFSEGDNK